MTYSSQTLSSSTSTASSQAVMAEDFFIDDTWCAGKRVLMTPYLCARLVLASGDLCVLKILRRVSKSCGIRRNGMERYVLQTLYAVTRDIYSDHVSLTYTSRVTGRVYRRETLQKGSILENLHVEIFMRELQPRRHNRAVLRYILLLDANGYTHNESTEHDNQGRTYYYPSGPNSVDAYDCGAWVQNTGGVFIVPKGFKRLSETYERRNYPLEPSYWK